VVAVVDIEAPRTVAVAAVAAAAADTVATMALHEGEAVATEVATAVVAEEEEDPTAHTRCVVFATSVMV
jgi:hypothetical protein